MGRGTPPQGRDGHTHREGQGADDKGDGHDGEEEEMVDLLGHGEHAPAAVAGCPGLLDRGQPAGLLPTAVHAGQVGNDAEVAEQHGEDEEEEQGGVEEREGDVQPRYLPATVVLSVVQVHLDEAPSAGAILHVLPKAHKRQGAEGR